MIGRTVIEAAGALPWRHRRGRLQVVMVHRPRYDDWSWAKGKLDPGEEWPVAAAREVFEETGLHVRLGRPLPTSRYDVVEGSSEDDSGQPAPKEVRYWAAEVVGGAGTLVNEIDEIAWLDVDDATDRLTYDRDRDQLRALVQADRDGTLTTWPLVILRHAHAYPRSTWTQADPLRPLDARGRERAEALVPLLTSYGVIRVVTSPAVRCLDTVLPYATAAELKIRLKPGLSEESFERRPDHAPRHLTKVLARGSAAVVSTHGPVLPRLLEQLAGIANGGGAPDSDDSDDTGEPDGTADSGANSAKDALLEAAERGMGKGDALVAHVVGTGEQARVVDVELYPVP
ncbi:MAG TPA: NUDIX hydrolase [Dermatophilaceae bacterium]